MKIQDFVASLVKKIFLISGINSLIKNKILLRGFYDNQTFGYCIRNNLSESLVLFYGDQAVSRGTFINGEFDLFKLLRALSLLTSKKPVTLLNIGANIGMICIPAVARGFFDNFIAIEPDPENFKLLRVNTALNNLDSKAVLINSAVGLKKETKSLIRTKTNRGSHRISEDELGELGELAIAVRVDSLQGLISEFATSNLFIVMDVEGYEGYVLEGAKEILRSNPPIMLEFSPLQLSEESYSLLRDNLIESDYNFYFDLSYEKPPMVKLEKSSLDLLRDNLLSKKTMTDLLVINHNISL
jgi:FkbM family methyltransferase